MNKISPLKEFRTWHCWYLGIFEYVKSLCQAAYYNHKNTHSLKGVLTQEAHVTYHIDCYNYLFYVVSDYNINQLHSACFDVINVHNYDHTIQILLKTTLDPIYLLHLTVCVNLYPLESHPEKLRSSSQILFFWWLLGSRCWRGC